PGVAAHVHDHRRQVSTDATVPRVAGCHGPSSTRTSTALMPRCGAQATPATTTSPAGTVAPSRGRSMRDWVLIGARGAHPRGTQYASKSSKVLSSSSASHLVAETYP